MNSEEFLKLVYDLDQLGAVLEEKVDSFRKKREQETEEQKTTHS